MWPSISDMSRDECRKCLRCLELDAYGNMVSVLRAQGPFTDEKRKLLAELAKVLHISNERHRAEIRRAVNDEKLSVIAEQLKGPNTCTDWAIEGRRTIPLLPRLKAHTAFTGLANSLSLVIAAANEKKLSSSNRVKDPIVKAETASREDIERDERSMAKLPVLHTEINARGKKRKRSSNGSSDNDKCRKAQSTETKTRDNGETSLYPVENRLTSNLPNEENELTNVVQVSIVTPSSRIQETFSNDDDNDNIESTSNNISNHHKFIIESTITPNFEETSTNVNTHKSIDPSNRQDITNDINGHDTIISETEVEKILQFEEEESQVNEQLVKETKQTEEITKISRPDSTTPGGTPCNKRLLTTKFCVTTKPIVTSSTNCVMSVNSGSTTSCGPGPPCVTPSSTLTYKKLPIGKLNHQSGTKMGITLNSSKTLKLNAHPNAILSTKANVIVVQKGSSRGVTLSHGGKEVLGKVIMGGKNLCLTSQKSSMALLPHRVDASSNGEQTLTTMNVNHTESLKFGAKRFAPDYTMREVVGQLSNEDQGKRSYLERAYSEAGNMILLDIRQDVLDKNPVLSQFLEASGTLNDNSTTEILENSNDIDESITNNHNNSNDSSNSIISKSPKTVSLVNGDLTMELSEMHETSNDYCSSLYEIVENVDTSELTDKREINETYDEEKIVTHGVLDAQTGIYNYETADGIIIEDRTEESIETSCIDIFSTVLDSTDINIDNLQYVNDEQNQEIFIETRENEIENDTFCERNIENLDDS